VIHLLKYDGVIPAAKPLGKLLAQAVTQLHLTPENGQLALVPVPLHSSKRRERQFNQSELIARAALKHLPPNFELDSKVLIRQRETHSQVGLDREARIRNMSGAFKVVGRQRIQGRTLVVVDDVMTTGTTVSECARVLKRGGAAMVFAATVARTLKSADATAITHEFEGEEAGATQLASV